MHDLPAFDGINFINIFDDVKRFFFRQRCGFGAQLFARRNFMLRKKLLRFGAGVSAWAVIIPINFGHDILLAITPDSDSIKTSPPKNGDDGSTLLAHFNHFHHLRLFI
jgi:hypothetical protein